MKTTNVKSHYRKGRVVRNHKRRLFVDLDFSTKAIQKNGELSGRERVGKGYDYTAPIRDADTGEIVGRASLKKKSVKSTKTIYGVLPVREVGI